MIAAVPDFRRERTDDLIRLMPVTLQLPFRPLKIIVQQTNGVMPSPGNLVAAGLRVVLAIVARGASMSFVGRQCRRLELQALAQLREPFLKLLVSEDCVHCNFAAHAVKARILPDRVGEDELVEVDSL
jgi:hypothetical protein